MGYESKFYVVDSSRNIKDEEGYYYAEIVAMFNLCKVPNLYDKIRYYPNTNLYIFNNNKSRFGGEYQHALVKEDVAIEWWCDNT